MFGKEDDMRYDILVGTILLVQLIACASPPLRQPAAYGSRHTLRFQQPPDKAAACFARNAEEHSSALVAEVRPGRDSAQVIVRVKNGVPYATADFQRAGTGSTGTIALNVTSTGRRNDLVDALVEGC
jgi:hypothetical protein